MGKSVNFNINISNYIPILKCFQQLSRYNLLTIKRYKTTLSIIIYDFRKFKLKTS